MYQKLLSADQSVPYKHITLMRHSLCCCSQY